MRFLFIVLFISFSSFGQGGYFESPDIKIIKQNIQDEDSYLHYSKLLNRFLEADSTLNRVEKEHLFYGFAFQEGYAPYAPINYKEIYLLLEKDEFEISEVKQALLLIDSILEEQPFLLQVMDMKLFALELLNQKEEFQKTRVQLETILDAIFQSGNGFSEKEAFYVLYPRDEYFILELLDFEFGGQQSLIKTYDFLSVKENEFDVEGLYFDVSLPLRTLSSLNK